MDAIHLEHADITAYSTETEDGVVKLCGGCRAPHGLCCVVYCAFALPYSESSVNEHSA
jgi:hypothetical protein